MSFEDKPVYASKAAITEGNGFVGQWVELLGSLSIGIDKVVLIFDEETGYDEPLLLVLVLLEGITLKAEGEIC